MELAQLKYKVGMPVVCFIGDNLIPIIGCIIKINVNMIHLPYRIYWSDGDESRYSEFDVWFFRHQAITGQHLEYNDKAKELAMKEGIITHD